MSKERELLERVVEYMWVGYIVEEIKELLAQPEQEPSSDDFTYNKLKESYDDLVASSFKEFQRGYGAALAHAIYVKEPTHEPLSEASSF